MNTNLETQSPFARSVSEINQNSSSEGIFSNLSWSTWIIIILILAFFGFNIFVYLAKGTELLANVTAYFASIFGTTAAESTKQAVNVSAIGSKTGIDVVSGGIVNTIDATQNTLSNVKGANATTSTLGVQFQQQNVKKENELNAVLNSGKPQEDNGNYQADDSSSSIQSSKTSGKSGWCFIGEDRGFRSCIEVGENDTCMSGDIFPRQDICVNPNLRT